MKASVVITFIVVPVMIGTTYWLSQCINLDTVTYGDSEAAFLVGHIKKLGKDKQTQLRICTVMDIPLHMRKYD